MPVQDFAMSNKFQLAILKASVPQKLKRKKQTTGFHVFTDTQHL
jgi:hypothetical protein